MALRCVACGAENSATNRYCGQCGKPLERSASDIPEAFGREPEAKHQHLGPSADLPPEVTEFDNQTPLIAGDGTDRRAHTSPEIVEHVHDHLGREAELHDQLQHGGETHFEVHARQQAERQRDDSRSDFLRRDPDTHEATKDAATSDPVDDAVADPASHPAPVQPVTHRNFLADGEKTAHTGVSGPSFLGLTDDRVAEEYDEAPEPDSHLPRNIGLAILAAVIVLAAVQWRSIRDHGLAYVQNGSMKVNRNEKASPGNPPAVAADNTSRDLGLSPATPKEGTPQPIESSPNANHALPVQQAAKSPEPTQPAPAPPAVATTKAPPATSSSVPDLPEDVREKKSPTVSKESARKPRPSTPSVRSASSAAPVSGADEMNRAARASDTEARAAWLWKAVGKGNPQASVELAKMYEHGTGVVRSCDQAQVLLRAAAAKGNQQAKLNLQQIRIRGGCSAR